MLRLRPISLTVALCAFLAASVVAPSVRAEDEEEEEEDLPPSAGRGAPSEEKPKEEKKPEKKNEKKEDKKAEKKEEKKEDKKEEKKTEKKEEKTRTSSDDVLEESAAEKKKREAEEEARKKAEEAAAAEEARKAAEKARLAEEKKAADEKRRAETREQRLASAKRIRPLNRDEGNYSVAIEIEPGAVVKGGLVEVRLDIARNLAIADPRYGNREPLRNLQLTANVIEPTGKKDAKQVYAVHSLGAPGRYGFHMTPAKDGVLQVQITGDLGDRSLDVSFPLHVGVWPPPDFDLEDKRLTEKKGG